MTDKLNVDALDNIPDRARRQIKTLQRENRLLRREVREKTRGERYWHAKAVRRKDALRQIQSAPCTGPRRYQKIAGEALDD